VVSSHRTQLQVAQGKPRGKSFREYTLYKRQIPYYVTVVQSTCTGRQGCSFWLDDETLCLALMEDSSYDLVHDVAAG
jgi:hypothetical protein